MDTFNHTHSGDQAYDTVCPLLIRDLNWHQPIGRFYTFNLNGSDRVDYLAVVRKDPRRHRRLVLGTLTSSV